MSWFYKPYVSVAERKKLAQKEHQKMARKGRVLEPVPAPGKKGGKIAASFWGRAWCDNLESYSDFENRLPRGRSYLRNGSVLHLGIEPGQIKALVMGSRLYEQTIRIDPLAPAKWASIRKRCQGKIGSLIELLQGRISSEIMGIVADRKTGLFPSPGEIHMDCSCPDWADLCKHLAAVLYGVGLRLDEAPELLFKLRGVDHTELIAADAAALSATGKSSRRRTLAPAALSDVFGIELATEPPVAKPARAKPPAAPKEARPQPAPRKRIVPKRPSR